jgi:CBS domain-containing protein
MSEKAIVIEIPQDILSQDLKTAESEILLKEVFWDKQIVDIHGSKVVRVNDVHLLKEDLNLWVVHMDIGATGLLRRLGWIPFIRFIVDLISSHELMDKLISWKFVQPITSSIGSEALSLTVHQSKLAELHPAELADILIDLGNDERMAILRSLDLATAAQTFQELPIKIRTQIAERLDPRQLLSIIAEMAVDELVDLLSQLPKKRVNLLLKRLPQDKVIQISGLLDLSERVAGSIMNTEYIVAKHNVTAGMVLEKIKTESRKKESIYYIYVLDDADMIAGVVTLRQLLTQTPEKLLSEFMRKRVVKVKIDTPVEEVAEIFYKYDFNAVPVVDKQNKIQGIIMMKDAFERVFHEIKKETEAGS